MTLVAAVVPLVALLAGPAPAAPVTDLHAQLDRRAAEIEAQVVAWRRDIHQHPELGNREMRTAALVAAHLRALGLEVRTGVAHTGVVGLLRGARPGPVVALRADMDALPVTEEVERARDRRDARLRPRQSRGHADGRGRSAGRDARAPAGQRQVHLPAG
jgi:amidohydrolase